MHKTITGTLFRDMLLFGTACIAAQEQAINDLNVFPVPDGDTGTNMTLTVQTAAAALKNSAPQTVGDAVSIAASALLRGARGNSGVILSLLFRGMSKYLKENAEADGLAFAGALQEGVATAYNAVMKPAEGTILTVSRLAADRAMQAAEEKNDAAYVLEQCIAQGEITLQDTVNMNPVLKKAGVVDAGGKGYLVILQGMLSCLRGEPMPELPENAGTQHADFQALSDEEITFTYDTVFTVRRTGDRSLQPLRAYLDSIGDSLVIGEDDDSFKVHVHTDIPGDALNEAQKYGILELAKIENMRSQRDALANGEKTATTDDLEEEENEAFAPEKPFGFLAVCAGDGLASLFRDLGADGIISGGQTMNPSTESILREIRRVKAETVFVLPNNKNIIMAAQQCIGLCAQSVVVIPTATVPQGIGAMMALDGSESDAAAIEQAMTAAAANVTTAQITYAARDSDFDGFAIKEGDYLAILDGKLFHTDRAIEPLLDHLAKEAADRGFSFITLFAGADVSEDDAQAACERFAAQCPAAEVSPAPGGQPVYYYIIQME